jgi:hypothetical protein
LPAALESAADQIDPDVVKESFAICSKPAGGDTAAISYLSICAHDFWAPVVSHSSMRATSGISASANGIAAFGQQVRIKSHDITPNLPLRSWWETRGAI